jgi:hypothetical protein
LQNKDWHHHECDQKVPNIHYTFFSQSPEIGHIFGRIPEGGSSRLTPEMHRKLRARLLFWGVELLVAIALDVARRFVKAWTASLAKRERSSEEPVQEPLMSGEKAPHPVRTPGLNQQDARRPAKRNSWSPAGFMNLFISAAKAWGQDRCPQLGAALAYYTVFSLAPL